ncbi:MAG: RNA pseudouridine synthase [Opitutaceae bacterium]|nr:RNA pseudouridine synthase [Opitutaceae bacterium]
MSESTHDFLRKLPLGRDVTLLNHDPHGLAAYSKPAGVLSHPNIPQEESRSLLTCPYSIDDECFQWTDSKGKVHKIWLLNRLDSATSGVILVCVNEELADIIRLHFRQKRVCKIYNALVFGHAHPTKQVWRDRLVVQRKGGQIRTSSRGNIPSECKMRVLKQGTVHALLELEPTTGRSHQLRVQCNKRHFPIVGDATYGDFSRNRSFAKEQGSKRLFLHSLETSFEYTYKGKRNRFKATAPLPDGFGIPA